MKTIHSALRSVHRLLWVLALGWTLALVIGLLGEFRRDRREAVERARFDAMTVWQQDVLYREWAAMHGGVYVPVTEQTPPNPYLTNVFEQNITTPSGRQLTLLNPSYMTRQVHELGRERLGIRGHITSLNPIRPQNAADAWETQALKAFDTGTAEVASVESLDGKPALRFMRPLRVEAGCVKCHAAQGYRVGDVRGGISVSVPLAGYLAEAGARGKRIGILGVLVWGVGLAGLVGAHGLMSRRIRERDRAEAAARAGEEKYRSLLENSMDAIFLTAPDGGILQANPAACQMFGFTEEELRQRGRDAIVDSTDPRLAEALKRRAESGKFGGELTFVRRDGSKFPGELSSTLFRSGDGSSVGSVIIRDVTDRKLAQEALRESEEKFSKAFRLAPVLISIATLEDGTYLDVNEKALEISGFRREEAIGKRSTDIGWIKVEDRQRLLRELRERGRIEGVELSFRKHNGEIVHGLVHGETLAINGRPYLLTVTVDITERKRAEEAVRESEQRYRQLLASVTDYLYTVDIEAGRPRSTTHGPGCAGVTGYAPSDYTANPYLWFEMTHPEDQARVIEHAQTVLRGEFPEPLEHRIRHKDGSTRWVRNTLVPRNNVAGQLIACDGLISDITERKRIEQILRLTKFTVDTSADAILWLKPDGVFCYANEAASRLLGYSCEDFLGLAAFDINPAQTRETWPAYWEELRRKGSLTFERALRRKAGGTVPVEVTANFIEFEGAAYNCSFVRDITERKRAEEALQRSESELSAIYDSTPVMLCLVDTDRQVVRLNRALAEMAGGSPERPASGAPGDVLGCVNALDDPRGCGYGPQCLTCSLRLAVLDTLRTGRPCRQLDTSLFLTHGAARREIRVSASTSLVQVGGQPRVLVCMEDITARKQLEAQFLQAQKMEAVGRLAGGVAHDFNNILAATLLHIELLQHRPDHDPELSASLKELERGTQRAISLTRQLLLFSRRQTLETKRLDLNELLGGLTKMLRRLLGEDMEMILNVGPAEMWVEADAGMLEQVVMNLCVNARDAMPKGGRLTLSTQRARFTAGDLKPHGDAREGEFVCLAVTDTGCGMDAAVQKRIFEPFFTTKEVGKGTGLGLATVYGIVKQHHGWIEVASTPGQGSTFRVYLDAGSAPAPAAAPAEHARLKGGSETILVVEDDDDVRKLVVVHLRKLGYRVLEARTGVEAVRLWEHHGLDVRLLFSDMVMPEGMTGLELAARLTELNPSLKVILCTGYSADLLKTGAQERSGFRFLIKPYEIARLAKSVRDCLDGR
jgi:two-component system, cell cycle sensor histidine kinase and response regulator CckA